MNNFESEGKRITTEKEILNYMKSYCDCVSDTTFENYLNTFKRIMLFYECEEYNPFLFPYNWEKPTFTRELSLVHRKMYKFLHSTHYITINHQGPSVTCKWNVPIFFVPILIGYILTTTKHYKDKKAISAKDFFKEMDLYIKKDPLSQTIIKTPSKEITYYDLYQFWLLERLGKKYFCNLEVLLDTYAETDEQRDLLYQSVWSLTAIQLNLPKYPSTISFYLNKLLEKHMEDVHNTVIVNNNPCPNLDLLYNYIEPFIPNSIHVFLNELANNYNKQINRLISFTYNYITQNRNSDLYRLSIVKVNFFKEQYNSLLNEFDDYHCSQKHMINNYFSSFESSAEINTLKQISAIWVDTSLISKYISCLSKELDKQYNSVHKLSREILRVTRISSGNTRTKEANPDYIQKYNLTSWIYEMTSITNKTNSKLLHKLDELPPFIYKNNHGISQDLVYPPFDWSEDTFIKTVHILKPKTCSLPNSVLIKESQLSFPVTQKDYMNFLYNLNYFKPK